jgi:PhnB protein
MKQETKHIQTTIAPWLTVEDSYKAAEFYKSAFDAVETYRLETPDGLIVKLSVNGAEFWVSGNGSQNDQPLGGGNIRMILTINDPDVVFEKAIKAGASEVYPVGEDHDWRLGRIVDPFGLHWEIGHPLL